MTDLQWASWSVSQLEQYQSSTKFGQLRNMTVVWDAYARLFFVNELLEWQRMKLGSVDLGSVNYVQIGRSPMIRNS